MRLDQRSTDKPPPGGPRPLRRTSANIESLALSIGLAVHPRRSAGNMRRPGKQPPVIHRELQIIRRISRERTQDRAQDSAIDG